MGDYPPEWPWSGSAEPPDEEPAFAGQKNSRAALRRRYPVVWAAAGLVLIGGCAAVAMHESAGRSQPRPAFCGLVECSVLRSDAALAGPPAGSVPRQPVVSPVAPSRTPPAPTPLRTPQPAPATPAPAPAPVPSPVVTPPGLPVPGPTHRPGPPPAPTWPWPSRWGPPPPQWPSADAGWWRHSAWGQDQSSWWQDQSPWGQDQRFHQPHWW